MDKEPGITGVILAGGQASRMGGIDKGLILLRGRPLIAYVLDAMSAQTESILISANRNLDQYRQFGYPVIYDRISGHPGPLAGMLSALEQIETDYLLCVPCDTPWLPDDLLTRLLQGLLREDAEISCAHDGERLHPVFALMKKELRPSLDDYLNRGEHAVHRWFASRRLVQVDFSDTPDLFVNINTPDELLRVEDILRRQHGQTGV